MADREPGVMLWLSETWTADERELETWTAEYGSATGVGRTRAGALRSLAADMERREQARETSRRLGDEIDRQLGRGGL